MFFCANETVLCAVPLVWGKNMTPKSCFTFDALSLKNHNFRDLLKKASDNCSFHFVLRPKNYILKHLKTYFKKTNFSAGKISNLNSYFKVCGIVLLFIHYGHCRTYDPALVLKSSHPSMCTDSLHVCVKLTFCCSDCHRIY